MLAELINRKNLIAHIIQALIWTSGWYALLWMSEYPINEWVGVAALGYFAWYVSHLIFGNTVRFVLSRTYRYAVNIYGEPKNEHASLNKKMEWAIAFLAALLIYGVGFATSGLMFILTWFGLIALDFPMLDINIRLVGLVLVTLGLLMMLLPVTTVIYMLSLGRNRMPVRERFTHICALAWSLITKERFMPKLGFGLNSQYIERSAV